MAPCSVPLQGLSIGLRLHTPPQPPCLGRVVWAQAKQKGLHGVNRQHSLAVTAAMGTVVRTAYGSVVLAWGDGCIFLVQQSRVRGCCCRRWCFCLQDLQQQDLYCAASLNAAASWLLWTGLVSGQLPGAASSTLRLITIKAGTIKAVAACSSALLAGAVLGTTRYSCLIGGLLWYVCMPS